MLVDVETQDLIANAEKQLAGARAAFDRHTAYVNAAPKTDLRTKLRCAALADVAACQARSWKRWLDAYQLVANEFGS